MFLRAKRVARPGGIITALGLMISLFTVSGGVTAPAFAADGAVLMEEVTDVSPSGGDRLSLDSVAAFDPSGGLGLFEPGTTSEEQFAYGGIDEGTNELTDISRTNPSHHASGIRVEVAESNATQTAPSEDDSSPSPEPSESEQPSPEPSESEQPSPESSGDETAESSNAGFDDPVLEGSSETTTTSDLDAETTTAPDAFSAPSVNEVSPDGWVGATMVTSVDDLSIDDLCPLIGMCPVADTAADSIIPEEPDIYIADPGPVIPINLDAGDINDQIDEFVSLPDEWDTIGATLALANGESCVMDANPPTKNGLRIRGAGGVACSNQQKTLQVTACIQIRESGRWRIIEDSCRENVDVDDSSLFAAGKAYCRPGTWKYRTLAIAETQNTHGRTFFGVRKSSFSTFYCGPFST